MYSFIIKMLFCIVASVISGEFYIVFSGKRAPRFLVITGILVTHMIMFMPFYDKYEILCDIIQIIAEFALVYFLIDAKILQKLIMYAELNLAFGMAAIMSMKYVNNKPLYFVMTLTIAAVICFIELKIHKRNKDMEQSITGKKITISLCLSMFMGLYAVSTYMLNEMSKYTIIVYVMFGIVVLMMFEVLMINLIMSQNENSAMKFFVAKKIMKKADIIEDTFLDETMEGMQSINKVINKLDELYDGIYNIYELRNMIIERKREEAEEYGCTMEVEEDNCAYWNGLKAVDCVTIMSNLLDNAIEAASKNSADKRTIKLQIKYEYFSVENAYEVELKEKEGEFITTKNGGEHGLGLNRVRRTVRRIHKHMNITTDNGIFKVEVEG